jgi:hypothetical protein
LLGSACRPGQRLRRRVDPRHQTLRPAARILCYR